MKRLYALYVFLCSYGEMESPLLIITYTPVKNYWEYFFRISFELDAKISIDRVWYVLKDSAKYPALLLAGADWWRIENSTMPI